MDWQGAFSDIFDGKQPYGDFQIAPARWLLEEKRNVILQAPTGAGKTIAAEFPFLVARLAGAHFPAKMIYSVPMRVLANQFHDDFELSAKKYAFRSKVQTGDRPEDRQFRSEIIFTTIDQTLSNFLGMPYALSRRMANLNAGAVASGYLVFDEFHLFPPEGALKTTIQMLRLLRGITPFLLMTATFSSTMLGQLQELLDAEIVSVSPQELAQIPTQRKVRRFHAVDHEIRPDEVCASHCSQESPFKRTLVVCNTIERAQDMYLALRNRLGEKGVMLLHSRFTRQDRADKEELVRREFGSPLKTKWESPDLILVATQVIEVGLDITSWALHTEVAPANSVLQRAGRCARYEGETGDVYVYQLPYDEKSKKRQYAPYHEQGQAKLCEDTWAAFARRNGQVLDFHAEQEVINEVHQQTDFQLLDAVKARQPETRARVERAVGLGDESVRGQLIREMDSWTLLVHDQPAALGNPLSCQGFSIYKGTLRGKFRSLQRWAEERHTWALMRPEEEPVPEQENDSRAPLRFRWLPVANEKELSSSVVFVVNPALVTYNSDVGLRFEPSGTTYRTPSPATREQHKSYGSPYQLETYQQHIARMLAVYQRELLDEIRYAAAQIERALNWPPGSVDQAARLAIVLHDIGKMERRWQQWAREYQKAIREPITDETQMIVHTHSDPNNPEHERAAKGIKLKRPTHAGEGAIAAAKVIHKGVQANEGLRRAVLTAITRHHSPQTSTAQGYKLHRAAQQTLDLSLHEIWSKHWQPQAADLVIEMAAPNLEKQLLVVQDHNWNWWLAYFLIVRALRLADGLSQEEGG